MKEVIGYCVRSRTGSTWNELYGGSYYTDDSPPWSTKRVLFTREKAHYIAKSIGGPLSFTAVVLRVVRKARPRTVYTIRKKNVVEYPTREAAEREVAASFRGGLESWNVVAEAR